MFIQLIDAAAQDVEATLATLSEQLERQTDDRHTVRRAIVARDRDDDTRFVSIVFFDSYEAAMQNSELPETDELSKRMMALADDVTFHNFEVVEDRTVDAAPKEAMT